MNSRPTSVTVFEGDALTASFFVTEGGVPFDFSGAEAELHVVDALGGSRGQFQLFPSGAPGYLVLEGSSVFGAATPLGGIQVGEVHFAQIFIHSESNKRTVGTVFPFNVREAYKLRGGPNA